MRHLTASICLTLAILLFSATEGFALPSCPTDRHVSTWTDCFATYTSANGDKYVGEFRNGTYDEHLEWAVVNRLKAMLDEPPQTIFNVTQSFALFNAILIWTENRAWVVGNAGVRLNWPNGEDHKAHNAREALRGTKITESPWLLSIKRPPLIIDDRDGEFPRENAEINQDFVGMNAEDFFKWLRDAVAHGDGRTIRPIHKQSTRTDKVFLAGFEIIFEERRSSERKLKVALYHQDMIQIGTNLADLFCKSLSGGDSGFEHQAGTGLIEEVTRAA